MRLSPFDIKKQDFARVLRGYDPEDVQAFLGMLADQWEAVLAEHRSATERARELQTKLEHYERVEEALQEALQTAREGSQQALENAKQEAATIIKKAVGEAEDLTRNAALERDRLLHDIDHLAIRREEMVARLRAFLTAEIEVLGRFDERTRPDDVAPAPLPASGADLLAAGSPVVLDPDDPGRLPILVDTPAAPVPATPAPTLPDEVPLDTGALDAVLEELAPAPQEPAVSDAAIPEATIPEAFARPPTPSVEVDVPPLAEAPPPSASAPPPAPDGTIEIEFGCERSGQHFSLAEDPLSFHVFEPSSLEPSARPVDATGRPAPGYAPDDAPRALDDANETWIVRPATSAPEPAADDARTASSDDIEKIKKILNDLD